MYLGRANVFPGPPDPPSLKTALRIDPLVPCALNPLLDLKDGRNVVAKGLMAFELGMDDVRGDHLDVPVAAEPPCRFC